MIISSKNTLLIILLEVHGIPHSRNSSHIWPAQRLRIGFLYSNHSVWSAGLAVFLKTILRTKSSDLNVCGFTCRLCKLANLYWYDAMCIAATSQSLLAVSRSLITTSVFTSSGISVRVVGILISMGMIASIPYVRAKGDSPVGFRLVILYAHNTPSSSSTHLAIALQEPQGGV